MKTVHVALPLLFASLGAAATCNKSNAKPWNTSGGVAGCNGDAGCIAIVLQGQCNGQVLTDSGNARCVKKEKRAETLTCSSNEVCFLYIDGDLMCLNQANGEYHDDAGGHGNYKSGIYTYADGEVVTNTGTAAGTKTGTATKTATTTKTGATTTKTSGTSTTHIVGVNAATTSTAGATAVITTASAVTAAAAATTSRAQGAGSVSAVANGPLLSSLGSMVLACMFWL